MVVSEYGGDVGVFLFGLLGLCYCFWVACDECAEAEDVWVLFFDPVGDLFGGVFLCGLIEYGYFVAGVFEYGGAV